MPSRQEGVVVKATPLANVNEVHVGNGVSAACFHCASIVSCSIDVILYAVEINCVNYSNSIAWRVGLKKLKFHTVVSQKNRKNILLYLPIPTPRSSCAGYAPLVWSPLTMLDCLAVEFQCGGVMITSSIPG